MCHYSEIFLPPPCPCHLIFVWYYCHPKIIGVNKGSLLRKRTGYLWSIVFICPYHTATSEFHQGRSRPAQNCIAQNSLQVSVGHVTKIWTNEMWTNALTPALHYTFGRTWGGGAGGGSYSPMIFLSSHWLRDRNKISTDFRCQSHHIGSKLLTPGPRNVRGNMDCHFILASCLLASNYCNHSYRIEEKVSCIHKAVLFLLPRNTHTYYMVPLNALKTKWEPIRREQIQKTESQEGEERI